MDAHMKSKKHLKKLNASKINNTIDNNNTSQEKNKNEDDIIREIKYYEYQIIRYKDILQNIIDNTINQIHKKQTMTPEEFELDRQNELNIKKIEKEDKKKIFNPKNIPIDWDGKPLPYWLYKVHGLGIEHKCEICGGASYWGRRAFEHHFQEWRHAYGMKCLRLPNTLQFKNITRIEDALKLHHKLIEDKNKTEFNPDVEEQYEDENGNVFNKKMIMDLKKQGLDTNLNIKNKENNLDLD
jgi:splicing factor 3A subunit 3